MKQLSGLDTMFFHMETDNLPMHISSCTVFRQKVSGKGKKQAERIGFAEIKELFAQSLLPQVPILKCKLKPVRFYLDQPYWVEDKNFNLDFHLRHVALPEPADWDALRELCAKLHAQPLNADQPLWEVYIIEGVDHIEAYPKDSFAMFLKIHHSIMDGRTGMNIMTSLLSFAPDEQPIGVTEKAGNRPVSYNAPGLLQQYSRAYINNLKKTSRLTGFLARELPSAFARVAMAKYRHELTLIENKPKTRFNRSVSSGRTIDRILLPLDEIKLIRKVVDGATVNDVILTIIGGAMYHYLLAKNEAPESSLVAGVPVDVRDDKDNSVQGNLLNFMMVSLASDIENPVERLRAVHQASNDSKVFTDKLGHYTLAHSLDSVYSGVVALGLKAIVESGVMEKLPPFANTIVSNIPTIPVPVYLAGAELIDNFGIGPLVPNVSLFHVISGINNTITLAFSACSEALPDSEFYVDCLQKSYCQLREGALVKQVVDG